MESDAAISGRIERERAFHDQRYSGESRERAEKYYESGDVGGTRYRELLESVHAGQRVLEYGCGTGSSAFDLAARGADVLGIDISPVAIKEAIAEAARRGVAPEFREANAEALDLPASSFDVVCGSGVLHHLDLTAALPEIARVLAPGGWAAFYEPLGHNPVINLYRRLTPSMRTVDEHPLLMADLDRARRHFGRVDAEFFNLFGVLGAFVARLPGGRWVRTGLVALDRWLLRVLPASRRLAWVVVLRLAEPKPGP